ncbi:MAG: hypothetical protein AB7E77_05475 [Desulfobulbus sp.]
MTDTDNRTKSHWAPWSNWPLQRIFHTITGLVLVFFTVILILGVRQYLLYDQCRLAVAAGDRLLFQFTTIKDHLNESVVGGQEVNLRNLSEELQLLNKEVSHLSSDILVPEGLKSSLPSRVDLIGLEVQLRSIQEKPDEKNHETVALIRALSGINIGLQQFRFGLGDHTQRILLGLHKIIAGALGLIVVLSCTLLYLLNQSLTAPIMALCRLSGVEAGASCSLKALTAQIERLQVQAGALGSTPCPDSSEPEALHQRAHRFRCIVLGVVGTELASELTNRLNGVLNYTQTLIDVEDKEEGPRLRADILPRLVHEEKKAAELVGIVQRVGHWQPARPSSIPLQRLFTQLTRLLEKILRAESITLELPDDNRFEVLVPAGDLWLVLLTLITQGRRSLNQKKTVNAQTAKRISIAVDPDEQQGQGHLRLRLSNSSGTWLEDDSGLWPDRTFCIQLMQQHRAQLHEQAERTQLKLSLELPYRSAVA